MIYGIGTDIVAVPRIAALHQRYGDALARRILTAQEWATYAAHAQPARFLAKRFAAKEAFAKAVGTGIREPVSLRFIGVAHDGLGKPVFACAPGLAGGARHCAGASEPERRAGAGGGVCAGGSGVGQPENA